MATKDLRAQGKRDGLSELEITRRIAEKRRQLTSTTTTEKPTDAISFKTWMEVARPNYDPSIHLGCTCCGGT